MIYKISGNKTESKTAFQNSVAAYQQAISNSSQEQQSEIYLKLGSLFENQNQYEEAVNNYRKALNIYFNTDALYRIKKILISKLSRPQEMVIVYQEAVRKNPRNIGITDELNKLQASLDRENEYIKASQKNPQDLLNYIDWGDLLINRGDRNAATKVFQKLVVNYNTKTSSSQKMMELCNTTWGEQLHSRNFPNLALEIYQKDLRFNPLDGVAKINTAKILQEQGKTQEAIAAYRQAIKINPKKYASYRAVIQALENK